jgi:hypothetical protein
MYQRDSDYNYYSVFALFELAIDFQITLTDTSQPSFYVGSANCKLTSLHAEDNTNTKNPRAYIQVTNGIRTHDQYSSGRETPADRTATMISRDNYLVTSLIGLDEVDV